MQYLDTGFVGILVPLALVAFVLWNIHRAEQAKKSNKEVYIRRIPGLNALDEAIGRATEMGRPILMVPGIGVLNAVSVQAIGVFAHIAKSAAQFGTPIRLTCAAADVYTVAQEVIQDVYREQGALSKFDAETVQFVSDRQFAFAAGVSGMIHREKVAAAFLLGEFYAESLIFAETLNSVGAIQVAGSTQITQTPFFIAACDYVLIGDEFYAASAYLRREPVLVGSLVGQDWGKMLVAGFVIIGSLVNSFQIQGEVSEARQGNAIVPLDAPRKARVTDTAMERLFKPLVTEEMVSQVTREQEPAEPGADAAEGGE
jgi:hypothetical protein